MMDIDLIRSGHITLLFWNQWGLTTYFVRNYRLGKSCFPINTTISSWAKLPEYEADIVDFCSFNGEKAELHFNSCKSKLNNNKTLIYVNPTPDGDWNPLTLGRPWVNLESRSGAERWRRLADNPSQQRTGSEPCGRRGHLICPSRNEELWFRAILGEESQFRAILGRHCEAAPYCPLWPWPEAYQRAFIWPY